MTRLIASLAVSAALVAAVSASAGDRVWTGPGPGLGPNAAATPALLQEVRFDQRLGETLPLGLAFRDESGRPVWLGDFFGERPVILVLSYYQCPMLCPMVLNGLASTLKPLTLEPGREFEVVVASINPKETPKLAAEAERRTLERYGRPRTAPGWHFLTGDQAAVSALADAAGFRYVHDKARDEYAHAAGIVIVTPGGKVSRYLFGIDYPPRDVRLALLESTGGTVGSAIDNAFLFCFHYDPTMGRYSLATFRILRVAAVATVLGLVLMIVLLRRREAEQPGPLGAA
ncbi:MAG TPA: SCO family protein [Thermoanaerobaculia bacterium]